jgi:coproporphyrinogen III oxidase-like Fe-S oxidoreductase
MGRSDILAIPGVGISVERLFLSLKHTLSNDSASMTVETASLDIVTKEWFKSGLSEGVNRMDIIKIHSK